MYFQTAARVWTSSPSVGSSRKSSFGIVDEAAGELQSPPHPSRDTCSPFSSQRPGARPACRSSGRGASSRSGGCRRGPRRAGCSPRRSCPRRPCSPAGRRRRFLRTSFGCLWTSKPQTWAFPEVVGNRVVSMLIVVLFPAPLGPRNPKISPSLTSKLTLSTAFTCPKVFTRPSTLTITSAPSPFFGLCSVIMLIDHFPGEVSGACGMRASPSGP